METGRIEVGGVVAVVVAVQLVLALLALNQVNSEKVRFELGQLVIGFVAHQREGHLDGCSPIVVVRIASCLRDHSRGVAV